MTTSRPAPDEIRVRIALAKAADRLELPITVTDVRHLATATVMALADGERPLRAAGVLTNRQLSVLLAMANGLSLDEVAQQLGLSPNTVRTHRAIVFRRLRVHSAAAAVAVAMATGLIRPSQIDLPSGAVADDTRAYIGGTDD
ncbi:LuxR C-terminal-related transcriptional regulator [Streptomyces syringium]|uniref:helix-turn-helix transcriptional regulator n=1 Tax=Streptomyces syringium TaxID=76729 RepID=UPI0034309318